MIKKWLLQEIHAYKRLSRQARSLIVSLFLFDLAQPFISLFISTFLWRGYQSVPIILLYNVGYFFGLPVGFFLNSLLLRWANANTLYAWGCVLQGVVVACLVFAGGVTPVAIPLFGIVYGIASGLFWGNRNVFVVCATSTHDRLYYSSMENLVGTATSITMPLLIGWAIVSGSASGLYLPETAYQVLATGAVVILMGAGLVLRGKPFCLQAPSHVFVQHPSTVWTRWRWAALLEGISAGSQMVLPAVVVILFIGMEGEVGSLRSGIAILSALGMYLIGRIAPAHARRRLFMAGILLMFLGWVFFGALFSALGVVLLSIVSAFGQPLFWMGYGATLYDAVDEEVRRSKQSSVTLMADRELFLNIGRILSVGLIFVGWYVVGSAWSLRVLPVFIALLTFLLPLLVTPSQKAIIPSKGQLPQEGS
ncbi:MAG: hypothetical protein WCV84_00355 [Patescibacteria group bacterium]